MEKLLEISSIKISSEDKKFEDIYKYQCLIIDQISKLTDNELLNLLKDKRFRSNYLDKNWTIFNGALAIMENQRMIEVEYEYLNIDQ